VEEAEYRKAKREAEAALAAMPAPDDKIVVFSRHTRPRSVAGRRTGWDDPDDMQGVVSLLVDRVETENQRVIRVIPTGPARPFFDAARTDTAWGDWRPRTDSNRRRQP
jgi:hypothetical protein